MAASLATCSHVSFGPSLHLTLSLLGLRFLYILELPRVLVQNIVILYSLYVLFLVDLFWWHFLLFSDEILQTDIRSLSGIPFANSTISIIDLMGYPKLIPHFLSNQSNQLLAGDRDLFLELIQSKGGPSDYQFEPLAFINKFILVQDLDLLLHEFDDLILLEDISFQADYLVLQLSLQLDLVLGQSFDLIISTVNVLKIDNVLFTHLGQLFFDFVKFLLEIIVLGDEFMTFAAIPTFLLQQPASVEVGVLEFLVVIGLELDQGLDIALDLSYHEVQLLDMFLISSIAMATVFLPNTLEQFKMLSLVGDHVLLLDDLLLIMKTDQRQLPIKIVLLLQQAIHLPEQQFLAISFAV